MKKQNIFKWLLNQRGFYLACGLWGILMLFGSIGMGIRFIAFILALIFSSILIGLIIITFKYTIKFLKFVYKKIKVSLT